MHKIDFKLLAYRFSRPMQSNEIKYALQQLSADNTFRMPFSMIAILLSYYLIIRN